MEETPVGEEPYGGNYAYQWYGNDSVPRGVFPDTRPDRHTYPRPDRHNYPRPDMQNYSRRHDYGPFGMIDCSRRDGNAPGYSGAQFDYGVGYDGQLREYTPRHETGRRRDVGNPTEREVNGLNWRYDPPLRTRVREQVPYQPPNTTGSFGILDLNDNDGGYIPLSRNDATDPYYSYMSEAELIDATMYPFHDYRYLEQ
ncbi:hypothetical protein LTR36_007165 [Oleoguttula mirabilis]|uniref:Uncharacterized protein n=1 Tax=Oleoguttula mirabilis TaxID=1507867 RepID=A0AAV9JB03_9PEZI|nr:hypothetical protein LTR36_007165 [Oleoguttula mirabilis]